MYGIGVKYNKYIKNIYFRIRIRWISNTNYPLTYFQLIVLTLWYLLGNYESQLRSINLENKNNIKYLI